MKRGYLAFVLSVLIIAAASGCGADVGDTSAKEQSASESAAQTEAAEEAGSQDENADGSEAEEDPVIEEQEVESAPEETVAEKTDAPEITESVTDLYLAVDKREVCIGEDDNEIIFVARDIMIDTEVELIDADTGEVIGKMLDDADFANSGDDIMGDAWYSMRYKVDVDFPVDPDVSEDRTYRYYARYIDGTTEHRSEDTEVFVYESFTDKELDDMETVDTAIQELMGTDGFKDLSIDEKRELMLELLYELEADGLIDKGSIYPDDDTISFSYCGGVLSGIMLKPFDPMMN